MPIIYRRKPVAKIVYRGKEVVQIYKGNTSVYTFGWLTQIIVSWSVGSRASQKEVPNPDWPIWNEGRDQYVKALEAAEDYYNSWITNNPKPSETKDNPDWWTWYDGKRPYQSAYNSAKRAYDKVMRNQPDREIPNPDFDQAEFKRLLNDSENKNKNYQDWKSSNPEPPKNIPNPNFSQAEYDRLTAEVKRTHKELDDHKANEPPKSFTEVNPDWTTWDSTHSAYVNNTAAAQRAYDAAVSVNEDAAGKVTETYNVMQDAQKAYDANPTQANKDALDTATTRYENAQSAYENAQSAMNSAAGRLREAKGQQEAWERNNPAPQKWINVPNPEWETWYSKTTELEEAFYTARSNRTIYTTLYPKEIKNPEWDTWHSKDLELQSEIESATHALAEYVRTHPEKIPNPAYSDWYYNEYQPAKSELDSKRADLNSYISSNPEPDKYIPNPAYDDWVSAERAESHKVDVARSNLSDYDSKEPSKSIWIPITLYKCVLKAHLAKDPPAGKTSKDVVNISLSSKKYAAALTLSLTNTSSTASSTYESEELPTTAIITVSSSGGEQTKTLSSNTSWTTGNVNFKLDQ